MNVRVKIHHEVERLLSDLLAEAITAATPADPFGLDHDCRNPAGHVPIASCGEIVCFHCAKVFWQ